MQLFYNPDISELSKNLTFNKEESKHIVKVLRMKEGDALSITDGKGCMFTSVIANANPKACVATIVKQEIQPSMPYNLHLAVAPTKLNDRYEWFLEKATEIGVSEITPIFCDHSERKNIKQERFEKILQSALKQSLKAHLPLLNASTPFVDFINSEKHTDAIKYIAHCEQTDRHTLKSKLFPKKNITILIGPEGDFSPEEIQLATQNGFLPVSLGNSRLRTETAAIVACHSVAFVYE